MGEERGIIRKRCVLGKFHNNIMMEKIAHLFQKRCCHVAGEVEE